MTLFSRLLSISSSAVLLGLSACQNVDPAISGCQTLLTTIQRTVNEAKTLVQDEPVDGVSQIFYAERWLQAADALTIGAEAIAQLRLRDAELRTYQTQISEIYQQQAEATYAMVKARQDKDLEAAQAAQTLSQAAGSQEESTGQALDQYCQSKYQAHHGSGSP
ncbi:hypothetical protein [Picosynechococcus sp. NKBG15041c]|uniref:hypothetical protein n=1 Tax=Picosynechococcus sp. NKBG15041c TaxID=1407650 RepID=UPI000466126D|nr:hypothetical protein [Picosynechococcus sp. NKBG15041c]